MSERIAVVKSPGLLGSLSAGTAGEREGLFEDIELLPAADDTILTAHGFLALASGRRDL